MEKIEILIILDCSLEYLRWGCMGKEDEKVEKCPRCNSVMKMISECHVRCESCGAEYDCNDKGLIW